MRFTEAVQPFSTAASSRRQPYERRIVIACQGGGALTCGGAEAIDMMLPQLMEHGKIVAGSGTSGAAILMALMADGINRGLGPAGVSKNFRRFWTAVGDVNSAYGISQFQILTASPMGAYFASLAASALVATGGPTHKNRDLLNNIIGNGHAMRQGPFTPYINYMYEGAHVVARGPEVTADKVVGSGGLDELGNHRVINWMNGKFETYREGAYKGGANPAITPMIEEQNPTDIVIFTLHGPASRIKPLREQNLITTEIHDEIALLRRQYAGRVNFHTIHLDFDDMDHLNTDPHHLKDIATIAREQTLAQLPAFMDRFIHARHVRFDAPPRHSRSAASHQPCQLSPD